MLDHRFGHRSPATVVFHSTVAVATIAVPIVAVPEDGLFRTIGLVGLVDTPQVIADRTFVQRRRKIDVRHDGVRRCSARRSQFGLQERAVKDNNRRNSSLGRRPCTPGSIDSEQEQAYC